MKANIVSFSFGIKNFLTVFFFLFLSIACYGQTSAVDNNNILVKEIIQEFTTKRYNDCIVTCQKLEKELLKSNQTDTQMYVNCLLIKVKALFFRKRNMEAIPLAEKALKIQEKNYWL